jgi:alkanesulfonate monooxygenase SsuD/methylene tetrahydromethanopterin reductase-like flavin-dependent oxidoreductase (luciferase family)
VVVSGVCAETAAAAAAVAEGLADPDGGGGPAVAGKPFFTGSPGECAEKLVDLAGRLEVEEVMILDFIAGQWQRRVRIYELIAGALGLHAGG